MIEIVAKKWKGFIGYKIKIYAFKNTIPSFNFNLIYISIKVAYKEKSMHKNWSKNWKFENK